MRGITQYGSSSSHPEMLQVWDPGRVYNRSGVFMSTSWQTSCPHWYGLREDALLMIILLPSQGDFCATANVQRYLPPRRAHRDTPAHRTGRDSDYAAQRTSDARLQARVRALSADGAGSPEHQAPAHAAILASRWCEARPPLKTAVVPTHASCTPARSDRLSGALHPDPGTR